MLKWSLFKKLCFRGSNFPVITEVYRSTAVTSDSYDGAGNIEYFFFWLQENFPQFLSSNQN